MKKKKIKKINKAIRIAKAWYAKHHKEYVDACSECPLYNVCAVDVEGWEEIKK
jgi:hypothetical protein